MWVIHCLWLKKKKSFRWLGRERKRMLRTTLMGSYFSPFSCYERGPSRSIYPLVSIVLLYFEWRWEVKGDGQAAGCRFVSYSWLHVFASRFWFSLAVTLCISHSLSPLSLVPCFTNHIFFLLCWSRSAESLFFRNPHNKTAAMTYITVHVKMLKKTF